MDPVKEPEVGWTLNYFNYFTEIEEHFQKARGTALFMLSTLDWALIETWRNAGVPLEAALRGIDAAFEKWRSKKQKLQAVNSLTYCSQAVLAEAQVMAGAVRPAQKEIAAPFTLEEMRTYLENNAANLRERPGYEEIAAGIERAASDSGVLYHDLEQMEQRLTALEEKMVAIARTRQTEDELFRARRELELQLRPYRGKMSAEQIAMLERQYLERQLLEASGLPRLSLFYLH